MEHVFMTKSHNKAKKPAASKKNKENSRPSSANKQDTVIDIDHPIKETQYEAIETHRPEPTRGTGDISDSYSTVEQIKHVNNAEPTTDTSIAPLGLVPALVEVSECVENTSSICTSSDESDESEHPLSSRSDTSASDDDPVKEDNIDRTVAAEALVKGKTEDNFAIPTIKSELEGTASTVLIGRDITKISPASRLQGVDSSADVRANNYDNFASNSGSKRTSIVSRTPTIAPVEDLSSSIMFGPWDQPEQVPAYATRSHAAWFSNPANKIVRGVQLGIPRTVAELQRISRVRTVTPHINSTINEQSTKVVPATI